MMQKTPFDNKPSQGIVYTKPEIVALSLDLVNYTPQNDLTRKRVLDIGCGYGQFIGEVSKRLALSCKKKGYSKRITIRTIKHYIRGVEINQKTSEAARMRVTEAINTIFPTSYDISDDYTEVIQTADYLDWRSDIGKFDLVVGNLPYVKYESIVKLPTNKNVLWLTENFSCFRGRADYSIAFMEKALKDIATNGITSIITSNRFTQAEYGSKLRQLLSKRKKSIHELDFNSVQAFETNVSAYASLFIINNSRIENSKYITFNSLLPKGIALLTKKGLDRVKSSKWYHAFPRHNFPSDGSPWAPLPDDVITILSKLINNYPSLEERNITVKKGPATGANSIFIGDINAFPFELSTKRNYLLPLFHSGSSKLSRNKLPNKYLISVYEPGTGRLFDFDELPEDLQNYLILNKEALIMRHIVKNQNRAWWGMIERFDPLLRGQNKVFIPDLQKGKSVRIDYGKLFPYHSVIYAITSKQNLPALATFLQSPLVDLFRIWKSPMMHHYTPRASSKSISKLPSPVLSSIGNDNINKNLDYLSIYNAFDMDQKDIDLIDKVHTMLF